MFELSELLDELLGLGTQPRSLTTLQVGARTVLMYLAGFALLRLGEQRFVGKNTAFDVILGFIFGSTLARAINGSAPFFDTIVAGALLLALHWLFALLASRSDRLNVLLNGRAVPVIEDGEVQEHTMRSSHLNRRLLHESLRLNGQRNDPGTVQQAYYERNGSISVIPKRQQSGPRVIDIEVEDGVQTVRVELS